MGTIQTVPYPESDSNDTDAEMSDSNSPTNCMLSVQEKGESVTNGGWGCVCTPYDAPVHVRTYVATHDAHIDPNLSIYPMSVNSEHFRGESSGNHYTSTNIQYKTSEIR